VKVHFYDAATGIFTSRSFSVTDSERAAALVAANTPAGQKAFEGEVDPLAQRLDLATGALVDYQPPQPTANHEWNADTKRWQLSAAAAARRSARGRIHALESGQARAVREAALGQPGAADRLRAIDAQIEKLRALL
jgi:hypothetical protein